MKKKVVKSKAVKSKAIRTKGVKAKKGVNQDKLIQTLEALQHINKVDWKETKIFFIAEVLRLIGWMTVEEHREKVRQAILWERELCAKACEGWSDAERRTGRVLETEGTWSQMCANVIRGRKRA